ncbi:MAG: VOC family protein [Micrococcaceae bacterium]
MTNRAHDVDSLPVGLAMGVVTLKSENVSNLQSYYENALGLEVVAQNGPDVVLGRSGQPLLAIEEARGLKLPSRNEAGLFHAAFLFETQADLAAVAYKALRHDATRFVGSSDHHVSEAFYFQDPENNGIELYWDRPRDQWRWNGSEVHMVTEHLPWDGYLNAHLTEGHVQNLTQAKAGIGHVHLQVGDVATAEKFYVDVLGFDKTAGLGNQALFVSAGGYHHHMAMNTWNSTGAGPRRNTLGLGRVDITLPSGDGLGGLEDRLRAGGYAVEPTADGLETRDPWNTLLRLKVDAPAV